MKRIEFIAPVESMRGNLGSKQDLRYAENDNKAFDAPDGRQYARNYQTRYVGAKRASDGLKIFQVKTKAATNLSALTRKNMSVLGGTGAIIGAAKIGEHSLTGAPFYAMEAVLNFAIQDYASDSTARQQRAANFFNSIGFDYTENKDDVEKFIFDGVYDMVSRQQAQLLYDYMTGFMSAKIENPYGTTAEPNITIGKATLVKFWTKNAPGGATFNVAGKTGICFEGMIFEMIVTGGSMERLNILGLSSATVGQDSYVKLGNDFLKLEDQYVKTDDEIDTTDGVRYTLTGVAPEP